MQPRKRGRKPKPVVEFPQAVISEWTDVSCFHEAFALQLERHSDSIGHLHKALSHFGAKIERSTFVQWAAGKKAPTSVKSIAILAMIERRYRLPAGYFKAKLTNNSRAASGHIRLSGVTRSERRRLAWHLPDDFDDRTARERQEILQWVRSVIISGTTDYRRYQAEAAKHRFAIRFPSLTHRRRLRDFDPANEGGIQSADEADLELAVARADAPPPLEAEMADLVSAERRKADKLIGEAGTIHQAFIERLVDFRVLDPACGSGNFLYVALRALKDIEHRANLDAEALGLSRGFPRVGPECALGIELNPYAAELARVSVWIGEIQWMRRNGFDAAKNPILRNLDTIECRDAVLNDDGTRAGWPVADVVIGNPPFLGASKHLRELGDQYTADLRAAYKGKVPESADLVSYWFAQCADAIVKIRAAGLVASNSIRSSGSNIPLQAFAAELPIFCAWSDLAWVVDGAAVRVSIICGSRDDYAEMRLDDRLVPYISPSLTTADNNVAKIAKQKGIIFRGPPKIGPFDIPGDQARAWLSEPLNPNGESNAKVLKPLWIANDVVRRPSDRWIIDFSDMLADEAALFESPFSHTRDHVRPVRATNRRPLRRDNWWLHGETIPALRREMSKHERVIVTPMVSKHRIFAWMPVSIFPDQRLMVICRSDDTTFGVLHSIFHELWTMANCSWHGVGNDPVYNAGNVFETFPFPVGLTPDAAAAGYVTDPRAIAIAAAAARLNELRDNWLNPADLVLRVPEVVAGYPDRILPKNEAAAKELAKRTLTNLYNARPTWLDNAHRALDAAVADAYGWGDDWRGGMLSDEEILSRLLVLNQERASGRG